MCKALSSFSPSMFIEEKKMQCSRFLCPLPSVMLWKKFIDIMKLFVYLKICCRFLSFTSVPHCPIMQVFIYDLCSLNKNDTKNSAALSVNWYLTPRLAFIVKRLFSWMLERWNIEILSSRNCIFYGSWRRLPEDPEHDGLLWWENKSPAT